ncbi:hypothetical protein SAMN05421640_2743 [Ekhidna lutea]|uniref:YhhN-like protein n=1 Tax=Ekhidna lutea TaxID=447679 RepID=A0A239KMN0_EKHLU|nr:hypothetical protein SAMN05421640_2743 [Ekhidna lutea]
MEKVVNLILEFASIPVLGCAIYAGWVYKRLSKELRIIAWFILLSGAIELSSTLLWYAKINNFPLLHLYVLAGFLILLLFYKAILRGFISRKVFISIGVSFTIYSIINSVFIQTVYSFNSHALVVQAVLVIILSLSTYILLLNDIVRKQRLELISSLNWINSGLFIYYTSSLLIFYFGDFLTKNFSATINQYTWAFHTLFSTVMYICFFIGLWKRPRKLTS